MTSTKTLIKERKITIKEIAKVLELPRETVSRKINGTYKFTLKEAVVIWKRYFYDLPIEEVFREYF